MTVKAWFTGTLNISHWGDINGDLRCSIFRSYHIIEIFWVFSNSDLYKKKKQTHFCKIVYLLKFSKFSEIFLVSAHNSDKLHFLSI